MGVLLIITPKITIHLKHKRLLPKGNNENQGRVYKEKKEERAKAEGQYRGRRYLEIQQKLGCRRATIARVVMNKLRQWNIIGSFLNVDTNLKLFVHELQT
ncbi:hypothetical protein VT25_08660 [Photobacterium leiognathi subsp. mandapamensis]|nr:hypothetical protein VT25_08660 [Photobacterium leiognathi subsp. mandapamensis]